MTDSMLDALFEGLPDDEVRRRVTNSDLSRLRISGKSLYRTTFVSATFLEANIQECKFSHCYFERCYFRKTTFRNSSLTGSRFKDCNFDGAEFELTDISYAEFENCSLSYKQVASIMPERQNVLRELARNLRRNSQTRGSSEDFRKFLLQEIRASQEHNFRKAFRWTDRYYRKYSPADRVKAALSWAGSKIEGMVWGHGETPTSILRASLVLIVFFAVLYYRAFPLVKLPDGPPIVEYLLYSFATFVTLGDGETLPATLGGRIVASIETGLGVVAFGLLVTALYARFSKR